MQPRPVTALSAPSTNIRPARLIVIIAVSIYVAEFLIMILFALLPFEFQQVVGAFVDATLLTLLTTPVLIFFGFRPLLREVRERERVEAELRALTESIERDVQNRNRALATSIEVSRRLSTVLDPQQLMQDVVEQVREVFNYYHAQIYLFDTENNELILTSATGEAGRALLARGYRLAAGRGLVGRAAASGQVVVAPDTTQIPDWMPNALLPETHAEIAVPIASADRVLGVLDVQQTTVGSLGQLDVDLLQSIANQIGIALQNATAFAEAQRQAQRETIVNAISQKLQTATSIDQVLKIATQELTVSLGARRATGRVGLSELEVRG